MNASDVVSVVVVCGAVAAFCRCLEEHGHDPAELPHRCECGGSWRYVDGEFEVVTMPPLPRFLPDELGGMM